MGGMWSWTMLPRLIDEEVVRYLRLHSTDAKESSIKMWCRIIKINSKTLPPSGSFVSSKIISISSSEAFRLYNLKKSALLCFKKCIIKKVAHLTLRSQSRISYKSSKLKPSFEICHFSLLKWKNPRVEWNPLRVEKDPIDLFDHVQTVISYLLLKKFMDGNTITWKSRNFSIFTLPACELTLGEAKMNKILIFASQSIPRESKWNIEISKVI